MNFPIISATLNLTQACNFKCKYCFTHGKSNRVMPFDVAKRCVDFLVENAKQSDKKMEVSFWGGEPLLEWELLKKITLYAKNVAKENAIFATFGGTTNGSLFTPDKLEFMQEHGILFMVSIDGTEETHNWYRESHDVIVRNVKEILKTQSNLKVRLSPFPERIDHFFDDVKYLVDLGLTHIMFSPVYEEDWTEDHWKIWEDECYKVVDLIAEYRKQNIRIEIEHFKSYQYRDNSEWPCGAGRFYVGFDTDGSIYPCHRFVKFNDNRPWQDKEVCIGHIDVGITNPTFRQSFIDFRPQCGNCPRIEDTPCHGGCYAANYDLTGSIDTHFEKLCRYVEMQKKVSGYYKEKVGMEERRIGAVCRNMCYLENTPDEVRTMDDTGVSCICDHTNYTGRLDPSVARPLQQISPQQVMDLLRHLEKRIERLEDGLDKSIPTTDNQYIR